MKSNITYLFLNGDWNSAEASWNVMAHAQKQDFVFRRNGRVHLNRRWRQFSGLASEVYVSAVIMLDTPRSEVVWRVLATHSFASFPFLFPPVRRRVPSHFNWSLQRIATETTGKSSQNTTTRKTHTVCLNNTAKCWVLEKVKVDLKSDSIQNQSLVQKAHDGLNLQKENEMF